MHCRNKKSNQYFTDDKETAAGLLKQVEGWELRDVSRFMCSWGNRSIRVEQMHLQSSAGVGLLLASRLGLTERERLFLLWLAEREREREREGERPLGLETERERERDLERLLTGVLDLLERAGEPDLLLRLE